MLRTPVSAIFVSRQKLISSYRHAALHFGAGGDVYPLTMPGPPGKLMTRENLISRERHHMSPTYWYVTKLFLQSKFPHKGINQRKNENFSKILRFSRQQHVQKVKLFKYYTEKEKKSDRIVIVRTDISNYSQTCLKRSPVLSSQFLCVPRGDPLRRV